MSTNVQMPRAPGGKHEVFVEHQLARMRSRIRSLDAGRSVLCLLVLTLGYGLVVAGLDRVLELPLWVRLASFIVYALAGSFFVGSLLLNFYQSINPYYAARKLEETLPDAKNSVVNWLDLRDEKLPPVILSALGHRAARDLRKADPEQAVNVGPTWILAGVLAGLVLGLLVFFVASPRQFMSLMERAFTPFKEVEIASRTAITLVEPEGGDAVVPPHRPVTFRASVIGRVPAINQEGAPKLLFRYNANDTYATRALEQDHDGTWYCTLAADQLLGSGLWYKITASDAETAEYHLKIVPIPQVRLFETTFRYRPYLAIGEVTHSYPPALFTGFKAPRGTEVRLTVHANDAIRDGMMRVQWSSGRKETIELPGEILPDDPAAIRFPKLLLDREGWFTVLFTSKQGEKNIDRSLHAIKIIPDDAPKVVLDKPEKDKYPANGTIPLHGSARDDFGIKNLTLRMKAHEDAATHTLEAKPYRPGKSFKLVNGKYPDFLDYKDFVELEKIKNDKGQPFALKKGMQLELWLEAEDNCDFPGPGGNIGKSEPHKVLIDEPEKDAQKKEQERKKAHDEANQQQKNQDQDLDQQNKAAKEEQQAKNQKTPEQQAQEEKAQNDLNEQAKNLQEKLNKEDPKQEKPDGKGEAKGEEGTQSDSKKGDNNQAEAKDSKQNEKGEAKAGEQKDAGKNEADKKPGEARDEGQKDGQDKNEAQAKGPGKDNPDAGPKGTADKNEPQPKGGDGQDKEKSDAKGEPDKSSAAAKDKGMKEAGENPGQAKQHDPKENGNDSQAQGKNKDSGKEQPNSQAKDDKSGGPDQKAAQDKSESKTGSKDQQGQAKNQGGDGKSPEPQSAAKDNPNDNAKDNPQGAAKGPEKKDTPAEAKKGEPNPGEKNAPQAKGGGEKDTAPGDKSNAKKGGGADQKPPAQAKGDPGAEKSNGGGKEPGLDDVAKNADDLKKKDPAAQEKAEKELSRMRRDAKDPKVRDAADDALQDANRNPAKSKGSGEGEEHQAQAIPKGPGEPGGPAIKTDPAQAKGGPQSKIPAQGKGEPTKQDDQRSEAKGGDKAGDFGSGQNGITDDHKAQAANEAFAKRGGNLTLDDMKELIKKTGPAQRKEAGVSEQDWQKFLKDVQSYEQMLQKQKAQARVEKSQGVGSKLTGSGPYKVESGNTNPLESLQPGRFLPPPEFRQAHREFTRSEPAIPPKKK